MLRHMVSGASMEPWVGYAMEKRRRFLIVADSREKPVAKKLIQSHGSHHDEVCIRISEPGHRAGGIGLQPLQLAVR